MDDCTKLVIFSLVIKKTLETDLCNAILLIFTIQFFAASAETKFGRLFCPFDFPRVDAIFKKCLKEWWESALVVRGMESKHGRDRCPVLSLLSLRTNCIKQFLQQIMKTMRCAGDNINTWREYASICEQFSLKWTHVVHFEQVFFYPIKHCNFTGTVLWYYHRAWVTCSRYFDGNLKKQSVFVK